MTHIGAIKYAKLCYYYWLILYRKIAVVFTILHRQWETLIIILKRSTYTFPPATVENASVTFVTCHIKFVHDRPTTDCFDAFSHTFNVVAVRWTLRHRSFYKHRATVCDNKATGL